MNCLYCERPVREYREVKMPTPETVIFPADFIQYFFCPRCRTWSQQAQVAKN